MTVPTSCKNFCAQLRRMGVVRGTAPEVEDMVCTIADSLRAESWVRERIWRRRFDEEEVYVRSVLTRKFTPPIKELICEPESYHSLRRERYWQSIEGRHKASIGQQITQILDTDENWVDKAEKISSIFLQENVEWKRWTRRNIHERDAKVRV